MLILNVKNLNQKTKDVMYAENLTTIIRSFVQMLVMINT